jgi:sugar transferase EpsL
MVNVFSSITQQISLSHNLWPLTNPEMPLSKRLLDIFISAVCLVAFAPLMALTACLVRLFLGRPVLFKQMRPGFHGKPFRLMKFRSMTDDRDVNGALLPDEARLTRFGKLLRRTSLDELPQLINVIKGDLSVVGPRPLLMKYLSLYSPEQMRRHDVMPGITGWAQINGRNAITWEEKFTLDVWYVDNRSFLLDLKIMFITFWRVLHGQGLAAEGSVTAHEFTGSGQSEGSARNTE